MLYSVFLMFVCLLKLEDFPLMFSLHSKIFKEAVHFFRITKWSKAIFVHTLWLLATLDIANDNTLSARWTIIKVTALSIMLKREIVFTAGTAFKIIWQFYETRIGINYLLLTFYVRVY